MTFLCDRPPHGMSIAHKPADWSPTAEELVTSTGLLDGGQRHDDVLAVHAEREAPAADVDDPSVTVDDGALAPERRQRHALADVPAEHSTAVGHVTFEPAVRQRSKHGDRQDDDRCSH